MHSITITLTGAFSRSASYYGIFDQAGNVYEWTDDQDSLGNKDVLSTIFQWATYEHQFGQLYLISLVLPRMGWC